MGLLTLDGVWQFAKVPHASRTANTQSFENEVIKEAYRAFAIDGIQNTLSE
jgi:hypothetical protein